MDRAKTIKLASGGVNLFYTEAPASSASWWDRMFGDAQGESDQSSATSSTGQDTRPVRKPDPAVTPPSQGLSWITKFSFDGDDDPTSSTQVGDQNVPKPTAQQAASYKEVMDYLMAKGGFSKTAAAGIAGVFMAESRLKPGIYNESERNRFGDRGGRGLGQWTDVGKTPGPGWRRTAYENFLNGRTPTLQLDLDFFLQEVKSRPKVLEVLNNPNSTLEDVVDAMHRGYENGSSAGFATPEQMGYTYTKAWANDPAINRPYSFNDSANKRLNFARQAFQAYG